MHLLKICEMMAEKLNLGSDFGKYFDVSERVKRGDQYMGLCTPELSFTFFRSLHLNVTALMFCIEQQSADWRDRQTSLSLSPNGPSYLERVEMRPHCTAGVYRSEREGGGERERCMVNGHYKPWHRVTALWHIVIVGSGRFRARSAFQ